MPRGMNDLQSGPPIAEKSYRVANPRGLPAGTWILRVGDRRWAEGDPYDGPVTTRFVEQGFIVEVTT